MAAKSARKGPTKAKKNLLDSLGVESVDYKDTATLQCSSLTEARFAPGE